MRHQKHGRKLGRVKSQRRALFKTMLGSFIMREKIITTEAKAKELKSKVDKVVNKAKKAKIKGSEVAAAREFKKLLPEMAIKKIMGEFLKAFDSRNSGYARVIKIERRKADGAKMAAIEFVKN